ncbi:MAG TPA: type I DNA topoisomerase [Aestuariivirgaceae bacterium]|nr:type I DNA topoisomerase [Aestuariivirgaceae bacterium]
MTVVVVESPAKAKTINKYLGSGYTVLASYGHVRDLPAKDGSVRPDDDFAMSWELDSRAAKRISAIVEAMKSADKLILATDPDREGEAISWHVLEILQRKGVMKSKIVERVVFNAVTRRSVLDAMEHPRQIDGDLVEAYLARRALDYLVGFTLSPVLWRKLPGARSAGRVQSVALRLICERELEIESFRTQEYWTVEAGLRTAAEARFEARLAAIEGKRLGKFDIPDEPRARQIEAAVDGSAFIVDSVESKPAKRHPQPPFITSTLQQEASRKLGLSASRTMQIAQKLYEGTDIGGETVGLITYMRTDGVQMAPEAMASARNAILEKFGEPYLPSVPRAYKTKARNAQEAHEAIRPTDLFRFPERMRSYLNAEEAAVYDLIWKRTVASQMESAEFERTTVDITAEGNDGQRYGFRATGAVVRFDGFLRLYQEGRDDEDDEASNRLPAMARGDRLGVEKILANQHFTEPPPRYSEASLIKKLEELGIGRPSTYTAILVTLRERGYVQVDKKRLVPEDKGRLVTAFLEAFFRRYVEYDFTANLEEQLDRISAGEIEWKSVLRDFWRDFIAAVDDIKDLRVSAVLDALNDLLEPHIFPAREDGAPPRQCPSCEAGQLSLKIGRFGAFIGCSNYPECRFTRQLGSEDADKEGVPAEGIVLGADPETGLPVTLHSGRFGPYVQRARPDDEKPDRTSLPKGMTPETVDFEFALKLLTLPREVGLHPESGKPITAGLGRYGPFVQHEGKFANLDNFEEIFTVGLNRAVDALASKQARGGRAGPAALRDLGPHPQGGGNLQVMSGRYGPYIKYDKVNATLPRNVAPETVTLDQAVALVAEKQAKGGPAKKKAAARKKAPAKKKAVVKTKAPAKAKSAAKS